MLGDRSKSTLVDRITDRAKNNPVIAGLIVLGTVVAFTAALLADLTSLTALFYEEAKITGQYHLDTQNSAFAQVGPTSVPLPPGYQNFDGKIFAQSPQFRSLINGVRSYASRRPVVSPTNIYEFMTLFDRDPIVGQRSFDLALKARPILEKIKNDYRQAPPPADDLTPFFAPPAQIVPIVGYVAEVLSFLEPLYTITRARPLEADAVASLVSTTAALWPKGEDLPLDDAYRIANKVFRQAALRQVYPIITLVIKNDGGSPKVVTAIKVEVKEFHALADTYVSGPLELLGSVTVNLNGQPGTFVEPFTEPKKIAPKDAVQFKVRITSDSKGAYLANIQLLNGEAPVYATEDFIVVFDAG